jgi:non-heme chloroperoxidase
MQRIEGSGGVQIAVYDEGNLDGPVLLLVHGFSQAALCWDKQRNSDLAKRFRLISLDVRGHGASGKPWDETAYNDSQPVADDINAVLDHCDIDTFVFVGWSMAGNWAADYLRHYGDSRMRGLFLSSSPTQQGTEVSNNMFGRGAADNLADMFSPDPQANIRGTVAFLKACTGSPIPAEEFDVMLAYNMMVPPEIRRWMLSRVADNSDVVGKLSVPFMQVHGSDDQIVLPFAGEYTMSQVPHDKKKMTIYDGVGHCPFWETSERFNEDLAEFVSRLA